MPTRTPVGTWVCVDVQPFFMEPATPADRASLMECVARDLVFAVERGYDIVFTEIPYISKLDEHRLQATPPGLTSLVPDGRYLTVEKFISGYSLYEAAGAVVSACDRAGYNLENIRICGVNTGGWLDCHGQRYADGCVFDMIVGLIAKGKAHIDVVRSACAEMRPGRTAKWGDFYSLAEVRVLEPGQEGWDS